MIRFGAGPDEIAGLMKFLRRRAPQERLLLAPLPDVLIVSAPTVKHRPRVTQSPLLRSLDADRGAQRWGVALIDSSARFYSLAESDFQMQLFFGTADALGYREILLEVRDEATDDFALSERARDIRALGEKAIRRLRRRGTRNEHRWTLPP